MATRTKPKPEDATPEPVSGFGASTFAEFKRSRAGLVRTMDKAAMAAAASFCHDLCKVVAASLDGQDHEVPLIAELARARAALPDKVARGVEDVLGARLGKVYTEAVSAIAVVPAPQGKAAKAE